MKLLKPNKRTSGNGAVALWLHVQRLGRAVPECECWLSALGRCFAALGTLEAPRNVQFERRKRNRTPY